MVPLLSPCYDVMCYDVMCCDVMCCAMMCCARAAKIRQGLFSLWDNNNSNSNPVIEDDSFVRSFVRSLRMWVKVFCSFFVPQACGF
jgi:hypothetical protein